MWAGLDYITSYARIMAASSVKLSKGAAELLCNAVVVNASTKHSATLLFLHGLGDTGRGWSEILSQIRQPFLKIICPTAPTSPVTINGGYRMPSWFDIYGLDKDGPQDEDGIKMAADHVHELLEAELSNGTPANRIILGGFSQGGSLAIFSALTYPHRLAGILGLSSYLSLHHVLKEKMTEANKTVPFLQCHGDVDPVVAYRWGQVSSQFLSSVNPHNYQFRTYPGLGHSTAPQEMKDIQEWMDTLLIPKGGKM